MRVWTVFLGLWLAAAVVWGQQLLWRQPILTGEAVAYAPNGQLLATLAAGNQVALYQSGQAVGMLRGAQDSLRAIAFSPNSGLLVAGDDAGSVYLWQVSNGALLWRVSAFSGRALAVAFVSDSVIAVGGDGGNLQLRNATNGSLIRALSGHTASITTLAVSPNRDALASGDESGQARVWRVADGTTIQSWQAQPSVITALAWSANHTLAMGSLSGEIRLWARDNLGMWFLSRTITNAHDGDVVGLAFNSTNQLFSAGGGDGKVRRWDPATGAKLGEFTASPSGVLSFALRPDGGQMSTGVVERVVRLWGANGAPQGTLGGHQDTVSGVGFASSNLLATVSYDETLRLWQLTNGAPNGSPINLNGFVTSGVARPDGNQIAVGYLDGKIALRSLPTGTLNREWNGHSDTVLCLAYTPDGSQLVSGSYDGTAKVWNTSTGAPPLYTLSGHAGAVHAVAVSQQHIASCDTGGQVHLWSRATGQRIQQWSAHSDVIHAAAFSPNGALLATGGQDG
ncbi:MAG: WD40 repeat domain-containing protein, partial [Fimbriimonadales bacterium]